MSTESEGRGGKGVNSGGGREKTGRRTRSLLEEMERVRNDVGEVERTKRSRWREGRDG